MPYLSVPVAFILVPTMMLAASSPMHNGCQAVVGEPTVELRVTIDVAKTREPISKYVYGQFIEHLGRCIYGGIWAEMLEDRKFFYPVGAKDSPWKPLHAATGVAMDKANPFVGQYTPKIAAPGGIGRTGLGLLRGKKYVGHIWLKGDAIAGPVAVSLIWGDGSNDRQTITVERLSTDYAKTRLAFTAGTSTDSGRLEVKASGGKGFFHVGTLSLMPADNVQGLRADTLKLLQQLDATVYRWPGGNFASGYNWKDGIGDPDRRPPRKNLAWQGIEHNDFGFDEFMTFCRLVAAEPYVTVNSGLGDAGERPPRKSCMPTPPAEKPGGRSRAANGHAAPYGVKWWSVGNEMYGDWQLGHVPLEEYTRRHNEFAVAMRAADPSIKLVAVGNVGPWSEGMVQHCAGQMDLISEHFYCGENPQDLAAHVRQIPNQVRSIATAHRRYRKRFEALNGHDIRIALDEWNYWYGPHLYGELGTPYHLKDALGIAAGLHECFRQSDMVFMANYAQTVNVIGCIKTSKTAAALDTTGLALMLYRKHFGLTPVAVEAAAPLDVAAAWTADRKCLSIGIVNPTMQQLDVHLKIVGALLRRSGQQFQIGGNNPMAHNAPGRNPQVTIVESAVRLSGDAFRVAPCSITLLLLDAQ